MWALCGNQKVDTKGGNKMCKLKGWMDKGRYCNVQIKRWIKKGAL